MTFAWAVDDLNTEQVDAITEPGNVFLTACPGSGKTRALAYKAALELSRLVSDEQRVVAITYTRRAAEEIEDRVERLGVDASRLWVGTIHAFCLDWILRPYGIYHPELRNGFRVIDSNETERQLGPLCAGTGVRPLHCGYHFTTTGCRLDESDAQRHPIINGILARYWADLSVRRQLDFELILRYAHELVTTVPSIAILLGSIFRFILVDEFQDTKEIQYAILATILRASRGQANAFIVGDANQAIYGTLGGYAMTREEFELRSALAFTPKSLSINYRSSERVVGYFANFHVTPANIVAEGNTKDYASVVSFDRDTQNRDLVDELVRLIRFNIEQRGISPKEICVLGPQWFPLASVTRRLVAALPQYEFDGPGTAPFARDHENFFFKLARLALTEPSPELYVRRLRWAAEVIASLENAGVNASKLSRKELLRRCNSIEIASDDGLTYLELFFDELFHQLGIQPELYPTLVEHREAFLIGSRARIERLENDGLVGIADVVMFRRVFASRAGITISTIHGVKGAEFDTVIAFALLQGMVPHFADPSGDISAQKLLYVICSRARKNLHLVSEQGRERWAGESYEPTDVLSACVFDYDVVPA